MDEVLRNYSDAFLQAFEIVRTLLLVTDDGDFRVEILRRWPEGDYKPRVYKQVEIPTDAGIAPMLVWREYEMGYQGSDDPDAALKMALSVIRHKRGR